MKRFILSVAVTFLISCSEGRNELMTKFINEKKVIADSINFYHGSELMFEDSSKRIAHSTNDRAKYLPLADSQSKYWGLGYHANEKLKAIDFSIDSLSKMK